MTMSRVFHTPMPDLAADQVYQGIINMIAAREFRPGQRLPAAVLAQRLGVSRTPVREALKRLAEQGIVSVIPNIGARLAAPTRDEVEHAYEVRTHLEVLAARNAALHATVVDLARIEECIFREKQGPLSLDQADSPGNGLSFHRLLARASGNPVLVETLEAIFARTSAYDLLYPMKDAEEWEQSTTEHSDILAALRNRDPDLAERLIRDHVALGRPKVDD
jgi:DNA-binding GntR family transcriptional regulator